MTQKSESSFEEDDFVVYPTHGVGRILGTEKREVAGVTLEMLVVRFEHDRMTLRVPLGKSPKSWLTDPELEETDGTGNHYIAGQGQSEARYVVTPRTGI